MIEALKMELQQQQLRCFLTFTKNGGFDHKTKKTLAPKLMSLFGDYCATLKRQIYTGNDVLVKKRGSEMHLMSIDYH